MKEVINADECKFVIEVMPHGRAYGLYLIRENYPKHLLTECWAKNDCRNWIFSHFIGEKGTKFNIEVHEGRIVEDENGLLYLEKVD